MPPGEGHAVAVGKISGRDAHHAVRARDSTRDDHGRDEGPQISPSSPSTTLGRNIIFCSSWRVRSAQLTSGYEKVCPLVSKMVRAPPNSTSNGRHNLERELGILRFLAAINVSCDSP